MADTPSLAGPPREEQLRAYVQHKSHCESVVRPAWRMRSGEEFVRTRCTCGLASLLAAAPSSAEGKGGEPVSDVREIIENTRLREHVEELTHQRDAYKAMADRFRVEANNREPSADVIARIVQEMRRDYSPSPDKVRKWADALASSGAPPQQRIEKLPDVPTIEDIATVDYWQRSHREAGHRITAHELYMVCSCGALYRLDSIRRMDTPENRAFWASVAEAKEQWERIKPDWARKLDAEKLASGAPQRTVDGWEPMIDFSQSFDARDWAKAFVEIAKANPEIPLDEGTMIGWFANAIMRGYDEYSRRNPSAPGIMPPQDESEQ